MTDPATPARSHLHVPGRATRPAGAETLSGGSGRHGGTEPAQDEGPDSCGRDVTSERGSAGAAHRSDGLRAGSGARTLRRLARRTRLAQDEGRDLRSMRDVTVCAG